MTPSIEPSSCEIARLFFFFLVAKKTIFKQKNNQFLNKKPFNSLKISILISGKKNKKKTKFKQKKTSSGAGYVV